MEMLRHIKRRFPRELWRGLTMFLAFASAFAMFPPAASAGTYLMNTCNVPGRPVAPLAPWYWEAAANVSPVDSCAQGGGFVFYLGGVLAIPRGAASALTISLPASSPISIRRVRLWTVGRLAGTGSALFVGTNSGVPDGQVTNSDLFGPPGGETLAAPHVTQLLPLGTNVFRVLLYCSQSSPDDCLPSSRSVLEIIGAEVTLLESVPPSVAVTGGTLGEGDQSGTRTVRYNALDDQSGVELVELLVDNAVAAKHDFAGACPRSGLAACPASRSDDLAIDTATLTNGSHRIRLRVTDAAGNSAESPVRTAHVNNHGAPAANANASVAGRGGRLTASFAGTSKRTFTVSYGARPTVKGRLTDASGRAMTKAAIVVAEKVPGDAMSNTPVDKTDDDGRFAFRLRRHGASRTVRVQHASGGELVAASPLRLRVRASARLAIALSGVRVRYRGEVVTARIPRRGLVVQMQGRRRGGAWQAFASRRVGRTGRFTGTYRLRVRRPGVVLQFRAVVSKARGYPYESGTSSIVARKVR